MFVVAGPWAFIGPSNSFGSRPRAPAPRPVRCADRPEARDQIRVDRARQFGRVAAHFFIDRLPGHSRLLAMTGVSATTEPQRKTRADSEGWPWSRVQEARGF